MTSNASHTNNNKLESEVSQPVDSGSQSQSLQRHITCGGNNNNANLDKVTSPTSPCVEQAVAEGMQE